MGDEKTDLSGMVYFAKKYNHEKPKFENFIQNKANVF